ncbi:MAG TPA: RidA family protein [Ktedonobacterales bacterium]|jgi:enamine deaminase RidA (YjgF/YER057c/UK114 family)
MSKKIINPASLPRPSGFSHGILTTSGRMLFLAGQAAINAEGQIVTPGDLVGQYEEALRHLQAVVEEAGGAMQDIVKINIFVKDRDDYLKHLKSLGAVHHSFFGKYYPATALFEVSRFFQDGILVEIEGIAMLGADK